MLDSFKCLSMSWTLTPRCDDYTMCEWRLHTDHNSLRALVHHCILYFLQLSRAAHGFSPASFPMTSCLDNAFPSFCAFKYTFQFWGCGINLCLQSGSRITFFPMQASYRNLTLRFSKSSTNTSTLFWPS